MKFFFELFLNPLDCDKQFDAYVFLTGIQFLFPILITFTYYIVCYKMLSWNSKRRSNYLLFFILNLFLVFVISILGLKSLISCDPPLSVISVIAFSIVNMLWSALWFFIISLLMKRLSKNAIDVPF